MAPGGDAGTVGHPASGWGAPGSAEDAPDAAPDAERATAQDATRAAARSAAARSAAQEGATMTLLMNVLYVLSAVATVAVAVMLWLVWRVLVEVRRSMEWIADKAGWLPDLGGTNREIAGHLTRAMQADQLAAAVDDEVRRRAGTG